MESPTHQLMRNAADAGGDHLPATGTHRLGSAIGEVADSTSSSANHVLAPGAMQIFSFPLPVSTFAGLSEVGTSSVPVSWDAPGYDGSVGALQPGTRYLVRVASYTTPDTFDYTNAQVIFSTSGTDPGALVSSRIGGLDPNTTYWAHIWTCDGYGNISFISNRSTSTTLARPVVPLSITYLAIFESSITVQWGALPAAPPEASSMTAEGYVLEASTTNFGALKPGGVVYSTVTSSVHASTLTLTSLDDLETTIYIRVGSLNWAGATNYLTLTPFSIQIATSAEYLDFGTIDAAVQDSALSATPITVTNAGTVPLTYFLSATTATTPSSPWGIDVSTGDETVTLQALWNTVQPAGPESFAVAVTSTAQASGQPSGAYAGDQAGYAVSPGQSRSLWFVFWRPTTTITVDPQRFRALIKARFQKPTP